MRKRTTTIILTLVMVSITLAGLAGAPKPTGTPPTPIVDPVLPLEVFDVEGIAIQRGDGFVHIRLDRDFRQAHINIIFRGATITDVWDDARGGNGLEDPIIPSTPDPDDGILEGDGLFGVCNDDVQIDFGAAHIAKSQLYSCGVFDAFFLALDYAGSDGSFANGPALAMKITFTFRGWTTSNTISISNTGTTFEANQWIPLV